MTTVRIITKTTYNTEIANKVGSLCFPDEWYDCSHSVNKVQLRKNLKDELPNGSKIYKVLIPTQNSSSFKNIANRLIPYETAMCASKNQDGAYYKTEYGFTMWASDYPVGDAIVVIY